MNLTIPCSVLTVDFSPFIYSGTDAERRQQTVRKLAECCYRNGCVGITGHRVSVELLERAFDMSKRLFDLSLKDKIKAPYPEGMTPYRGYSGLGREQGGAKGSLDIDEQGLKEEVLRSADYKVRLKNCIYITGLIDLYGY